MGILGAVGRWLGDTFVVPDSEILASMRRNNAYVTLPDGDPEVGQVPAVASTDPTVMAWGSGGGGGGVPDSRMSAFRGASPSLSIAQYPGSTFVDNWSLDTSAGDDITLDEDGIHFNLAGSADYKVYMAQAYTSVTIANGTVRVATGLEQGGAVPSGDGVGNGYAPAGNTTGTNPRALCQAFGFYIVGEGGAQISISSLAYGGSDVETLHDAGIDIVRVR